MKHAIFCLVVSSALPCATAQQSPGPYPRGVNAPINEGNGVWRFDRPRGPQPAFFEQLAANFNLIKPPDPVPFGRSIALLVGVSPYEHLATLTHTSSDVTKMRNFLLESGGFDTVFEVRDDKVNSSLLNTYMLNYFSRNNPKYLTDRDRFLFYYSGHGGDQGNLGYLLFSKADLKSGDYVTDALDMNAIRRWAYVNIARQVLMILDTCSSGLAIQPMDGNPMGGSGDQPSGILLTAGTGNQEAYQVSNNQKGYGVFTQAILEALEAGMNSPTPFMNIFEVWGHVRDAVRSFEFEKGKRMQPDIDPRLPRRYYERANGDFVFLNRNPAAKNSLPDKRFAAMAVEKKGGSRDQLFDDRLKLAQDQFDLLEKSANIVALRSYVNDYKDLAGAGTWVALISTHIDEVASAAKLADWAPFRDTLGRIIAEAPTEFAHYGAGESGWTPERKWTPIGKLPESLKCTGTSTPSPLVRCTMFESPDLDYAERRLTDITQLVQATLPGSGWNRAESLDRTLSDYDANWRWRTVEFKNASAVTVEAQLWKSKKDGHFEVDVVVSGVARIQEELQRMITEAARGFTNYGACGVGGPLIFGANGVNSYDACSGANRVGDLTNPGVHGISFGSTLLEQWTPIGKLPESLKCTGTSTPSPLVRCTMFHSPDLASAERRLTEAIVQVQAALPGSDWTKDETLNGTLRDYDADWWERTMIFKHPSAVTVEAQLWKSKKDDSFEVDITVSHEITLPSSSSKSGATFTTGNTIFQYSPQIASSDGALLTNYSIPGSALQSSNTLGLPVTTLPMFANNYPYNPTPHDPLLLVGASSIPTNPLSVIVGNESFPNALQRMITEATSGFTNYGAIGLNLTPTGRLPGSLECTERSNQSPWVRCVMLRSPDSLLAGRKLTEIVAEVQAALPSSDWTKTDSGALEDFDADWRSRTVVFKNASAVTVEAQLWKSKVDDYYVVDVIVMSNKR